MFKLRTALFSVGLGVSAMAAAHAAEPVLNLKPGLWQTSTKVNISGEMPMPQADLSKLSPAQRAMIEKQMKQMMPGAGKPIVTKQCITKKELRDARNFAPRNQPDCKQTITKRTSKEIQVKYVCTCKHPASMVGHFKASSPTAYTGTMHGTATEQGRTITIDNTMQGKWLSSDCGNVKPFSPSEPATTPASPN